MNKKTKKRFEKFLEGYAILHAVVYNKKRMAFIIKHIGGEQGSLVGDDKLETRFFLYNSNIKPEKSGLVIKGWGEGVIRAWVAFHGTEKDPVVICSNKAASCEYKSDIEIDTWYSWKQFPLPKNIEKAMLRGIYGSKHIDNETYMFGKFRKLYKRKGVQQWDDLSYEEEHPNLYADLEKHKKQGRHLQDLSIGFIAIDGFSKNDIYCGGGNGDLWHYNSKIWKRLDPPINSNITAILCAQDGYAYIGMDTGDILKGRYNEDGSEHWELIKGSGTEIHSLAWFKNLIYIGSESGLYTINKKKKVEKYIFPIEGWHQYSFRNVSSCDEVLLSYGQHQALLFDGKKWEEVAGSIVVPVEKQDK